MKRKFFIAALAVSGCVMVSCDADVVDSATSQSKELALPKKGLKFNASDPIPLGNTSDPMASDGPGDDVIIITPPKKP